MKIRCTPGQGRPGARCASATDTQSEWSVTAQSKSNRGCFTRRGVQLDQNPWTATDLINISVAISGNVIKPVRSAMEHLASKHGDIVTLQVVPAGTAIKSIPRATSFPTRAADSIAPSTGTRAASKIKQKPARGRSMKVKKRILKRPAKSS